MQGAVVLEFGTGDAERGAWTSTLRVRSHKTSAVGGVGGSIRRLSPREGLKQRVHAVHAASSRWPDTHFVKRGVNAGWASVSSSVGCMEADLRGVPPKLVRA